MKRILKFIVAMSVMTFAVAAPVFAALPTPEQLLVMEAKNAEKIYAELDDLIVKANGNPDGPQWSGHRKLVANNIAKFNLDTNQKYMQQMQIRVGASMEVERVKLEQLNNCKSLAALNPAYEAMVPQALAEYQQAVANTQAARAEVIHAATVLGVPVQ